MQDFLHHLVRTQPLHKFFVISLAVLMLAGCATDINLKNAQRYYELGLRADAVRDYPSAREAFHRSFVNAQSGGATPAFISAVTYNLGRMSGYACDYPPAETLLLEALQLEQGLSSPEPANITKRLSELARLMYAQGKFKEASAFYERAVVVLDRLGVAEDDPIGIAVFLENYASALQKGGDAAAAREILVRASALRAKHVGRSAKFTPVYYQDVCVRKVAGL